MDEHTHTPSGRPAPSDDAPSDDGAIAESDRRDALISRVIDGEAGEGDWSSLRAMAERDPSVWRDLTETQRQHEALGVLIDEVGAIAEGVDLPEGELLTPHERFQRRLDGVRAWGGWAAAAAILLVWFTGLPSPTAGDRGGLPPSVQQGSLGPRLGAATPDEALEHYLETGQESGRVLGVVPQRVVLETRPMGENGGVEVVYLRQIIERELVEPGKVYRLGRDEWGQSAFVPEPEAARVPVRY